VEISEHPDWASLVTSEDVRACQAKKPGDNNDEDHDNQTSPHYQTYLTVRGLAGWWCFKSWR
jgi:hypothetical protein